jgi:serine/threonine protein kinase
MDISMPEMKKRKSIEVFCCYAREDQQLLLSLRKQLTPLQREGLITLWADVDINAGMEWEKEIENHLNTAHIILLLISPDFMASDYCYSVEMQRAMQRHEYGEAHVIPIILRRTAWQNTPLGKLQALPTDANPITKWQDQDDAFYDIGEGIREAVKARLVEEERALRAKIEQLQVAKAEQTRQVEDELLLRAKEEQALRIQIEQLQRDKEVQTRKAEDELQQRAKEEQALRAEIEQLQKAKAEQARQAEDELLRRVKIGQALKADIEQIQRAKEEQARQAQEELLLRVKEEQALRAEIERLRRTREQQTRKSEEELLLRVKEEQALRAEIEQLQKAEEERARQDQEEQLRRAKVKPALGARTGSERWNTHTNTHTGQLVPRTLLHKRYMILKVIGRGGMGAVYQARDMRRQGVQCAIKEMSLLMVPSEKQAQAIKNFKIEAKILSVLDHPCLPAFTHFFAENERYFLVMEYIDGYTLEALLERNHGPFAERRVLSWAEQICDVLEYLHSQNPPIIFRDMKPGNVMLTRQGHIKLIDFGIARFFLPTYETDTQLLGTPGYAPPEQYGTTQTDERSDIYALGMTLYHLLTNRFSETGFGADAREIRATNPNVSVAVACALEKATALELSDRYQSIAAFRRALFGAGAFTFETGESASEPNMLAKLCMRYPEEAFEYLASGEIANWLRDIGAEGLSAIAWHIGSTQTDPQLAVEQFLHAVLGQHSSLSSHHRQNGNSQHAVQWMNEDAHASHDDPQQHDTSGLATSSAHSHMHAPKYATTVAVKPKTLDFGPVYPPGTSAPLRITIDSAHNRQVKGTIQASQSWIRVDRTEFDGTNTYVNVQIRSSQLQSYTAYKGEVIISPEGGTPITVAIGADIQGYASQARRPGKTISPEDDDEDDEQDTRQPISVVALEQNALTKYGPPNETAGGWDMVAMSPKQQLRSLYGLTFTTACMAGALWYILMAQIAYLRVLPSDQGFVLFLTGMMPATTLGALLVAQPHSWRDRATLDRLITGISGAFVVLGPTNILLASITSYNIHSLYMLLIIVLTSLGATHGTHPLVSKNAWSYILQTKYIHWAIEPIAMIIGGTLGYFIAVGGNYAVLGILVGITVATAFIGRLDYLLNLYHRP